MASLRIITSVLIASIIAQTVSGKGEFQLKVESLEVRQEDLLPGDNIKIRICWSHYQREMNADTITCTYGEEVSRAQRLPYQNNSFTYVQPFDFGWPGTFSLVVEALVERKSLDETRTLYRLASLHSLDISTEWTHPKPSTPAFRFAFRAVCSTNYYGGACDKLCRPRNDRFGHYECDEEGNRVCTRGWTGAYCEKPVCRPGCKGTCSKPYECDCHVGWEGAQCDKCIRYPGCKHGSCDQPFTCKCEEGWGGMLCNRDLNFCTNNAPCRNGGTCVNSGDGRYTCKCPIGFGGKNCGQKLSGCNASPCMNGGTCHEESANSTAYSCNCPEGFFGLHCELRHETCANKKCLNGATCRDTTSGPQCICRSGYEGAQCEHKINPCDANPCMNNGQCTPSENSKAPFKCTCPEGFNGHRCEIKDHCMPNPCENGATCQSNGEGFKCFCRPGYAGANCTTRVDHCLVKPCANGGTCFSLQNDFECACPAGFTGKDCSVNINECRPNPCMNGGKCTDLIDGYKCTCKPAFYGSRCEFGTKTNYGAYGTTMKHMPEQDVISAAQKATILTLGALLILSIALGAVAYYRKHKANEIALRQNEKNRSRMNNTIYRGGSDTLFRNSLRPDGLGGMGTLRYSLTPAITTDPCGVFLRPPVPSPAIRSVNTSLDDIAQQKRQNKTNGINNDSHLYATVCDYVDNNGDQFSRYSCIRSSGLYSNPKILNTEKEDTYSNVSAKVHNENHYENLKSNNNKPLNNSSDNLKADLKGIDGASCSSGLKNNNEYTTAKSCNTNEKNNKLSTQV